MLENVNLLKDSIKQSVQNALMEDVGSGDITSKLINLDTIAKARVITREKAIICGKEWVKEVFLQIDPSVKITWLYNDAVEVNSNSILFTVEGNARSILTSERTALNFLQLLSGTATTTNLFVKRIAHTSVKLLDTRKTIVGLRLAQKYAVKCGGGNNHRLGLYDAFLIKDNHITVCGSISKAVNQAKLIDAQKLIEVEVSTLSELDEAIVAKADIVMLDNFNITMLSQAVKMNRRRVKLEVSGGINIHNIKEIAEIGVDYISVGSITKDVKAVDLSMQFM